MLTTRCSLLATGCVALFGASAGAQPFDVPWFTIDAGGGVAQGGPYQMSGTIGQPDASLTALTGGSYELSGGYWVSFSDNGCNVADIASPFGILDGADVNAFISAFGVNGSLADLNNDGIVDGADVNAFISAFGAGCP